MFLASFTLLIAYGGLLAMNFRAGETLLVSGAPVTSVTAIMTVRPYGRVVLMGGVGMLGGEDLPLPYAWIMRNNIAMYGRWMYS